jgi:hypothetical protein
MGSPDESHLSKKLFSFITESGVFTFLFELILIALAIDEFKVEE